MSIVNQLPRKDAMPEPRGNWVRPIVIIGLVILVVAIVAGFFFPAVQKVREDAARSQSLNHIKQMGVGIHGIASRTEGLLPPSVGIFPKAAANNKDGPNSTLFFHLLSEIEHDFHYTKFKDNPDAADVVVKTYSAILDPSNPGNKPLLTSYASNAAVFGLTDGGTTRLPQMFNERGTSNYVMFMERFAVVGPNETRHTWNDRGPLGCYLYPPIEGMPTPNSMVMPQFDVVPKVAFYDAPHSFTGKTLLIGLADSSARTITTDVTRTFQYAEGQTATIWAWACTLEGPLAKEKTPEGW